MATPHCMTQSYANEFSNFPNESGCRKQKPDSQTSRCPKSCKHFGGTEHVMSGYVDGKPRIIRLYHSFCFLLNIELSENKLCLIVTDDDRRIENGKYQNV
jgi:hypothetical protein